MAPVVEGRPFEVAPGVFVVPDGRAPFALRVDPTFGPDNAVDGIMCAAIDMSRIRSLESEQLRLADELRTALQR